MKFNTYITVVIFANLLSLQVVCGQLISERFGKLNLNDRVGSVVFRENGCPEYRFLTHSLFPNFGLPAGVSFKSDGYVAKLLDLSPMALNELASCKERYISESKAIVKELRENDYKVDEELRKRYRAKEDKYLNEVIEVLGPEKWKKLTNCFHRVAFFNSSIEHYLTYNFVNVDKGVTQQQIDGLNASRRDRLGWLKKEINRLYFSAFDILLEPLDDRQKKSIKDMADAKNEFFLRSPSTMHHFAANMGPSIKPIDRKLAIYQSWWQLNPVHGQLDLNHIETYESSRGDLLRNYQFFGTHFGNEKQKKAIAKMIDYIGLMDLINDAFREEDENGKVPYVDFMNKQFRDVQNAGDSDLFNQFVFSNQLTNIGLISGLESETVFELEIANPSDWKKIEKQSEKVSKFLVDESNKILEKYLEKHLKMFPVKVRHRMREILFSHDETERTMIPLEMIYLNILLEAKDKMAFNVRPRLVFGHKILDSEYWTDSSVGKDLRPSTWGEKESAKNQ